jgi:GDP-D-mannose dehydratase
MLSHRALLTGVAGQDGSHFAELFGVKGSAAFGIGRLPGHDRNLHGVRDRMELIDADRRDRRSLARALRRALLGELSNCASASFVPLSPQSPPAEAKARA